MASVAILMVGLSEDWRELIGRAAQAEWTHANSLAVDTLDEALRQPGRPGAEILVLGARAAAGECRRAMSVVGPDALPRWPVVVVEQPKAPDALWWVPPDRRDSAELGSVLRRAWAHHVAVREAQRARGDLWTIARRLSHEMRSPLGCILTSADVIREELGGTSGAGGGIVQPIIESAHELMRLLDRFTLLARASAVPAPGSPVDMGMIVWAAQERLAVAIKEADAEISEPGEWPVAVGQREWLERVWQSLLENALQHAGPRPRIELGWQPRGDELHYYVRDRGPGVAPDLVPRLFRPFHQLHQSDSGRGLGLALVQRLVELQGGKSGYEPNSPSGAYFYFTLAAPAGGTDDAGTGSMLPR